MYARVWENRYCITCIICITRISRTPHTYTGIASRLRPYRATPIYVWANVNIRMKRCPGNPFCQLYYELDIIIQSVGSFGAAIAVFHLPDSRRD